MPRSATANIDVDTGIPVGAAGPRKRWYHLDTFNKKPNKDAAFTISNTSDSDRSAEIETFFESDEYCELAGADAQFSDLCFDTAGGLNLKTDTTSVDQAALLPLTVSDFATGMTAVTFDTTKRPAVEWGVTTSADIGSQTIWAGFVLTHEDPYAVTTDADQIKVEYVAGANAGVFMIRYSIAGTDSSINTAITVKASTAYWIKVAVDNSRFGNVWIGESSEPGAAKYFKTASALTSLTTLQPTVGIQTGEAAEHNIDVNYVALGRDR